jgi:flagellin
VASGGPAAGDTLVYTPTGGSAQTFTFGAGAGQVAVGSTGAQSMQNLAAAMKASGIIGVSATGSGVLTVTGGTAVATIAAGKTSAAIPSGVASINLVNAAISKIGATLSALGSATTQLQGLSDFMGKLETSAKTSLGAMVDANLSDESAKLASLQTKQSLAIQSLSLANQGPSALLQLFR